MTDATRPSWFARFFALDDLWVRGPRLDRGDVVTGVAMLALSGLVLEMQRSAGALESVDMPLWVQWIAVVAGALLLVGRRRWPLTVMLLAAVHMFVVGVTMPAVMGGLSMQLVYFVAIYSGVAWASSRRDTAIVTSVVIGFMFAWVAWQFAVGNSIQELVRDYGDDLPDEGLVGPITANVVLISLVNVMYFLGAAWAGQASWRRARQQARLEEQAATISDQADGLQRRAVLEERLRIARELHDVVAHHVSVIGIQAGAARRLLAKDPDGARGALSSVETSSREAVTQMRSLVGTLRDPGDAAAEGDRAPDPGAADLERLVSEAAGPGLRTSYAVVETTPGAAARLPGAVGLSAYRIVQEALTNVRRHSTATTASVVLRVVSPGTPGNPAHAEVEVTDNGRPRPGTSGSGLGLLGIRERATSRGGQIDIGPRVGGGFRVRVRLPLTDEARDPVAEVVRPERTAPERTAPEQTAPEQTVEASR